MALGSTTPTRPARVKAFSVLNGATGDGIVSRLTNRFSALLVDEAQDCDDAEMGIIRRLSGVGLEVTIVADPDQAIYEFRGWRTPNCFLLIATSNERETVATYLPTTGPPTQFAGQSTPFALPVAPPLRRRIRVNVPKSSFSVALLPSSAISSSTP